MIPEGCVEECPGCKYRELTEADSDQKKNHFLATVLVDFKKQLHPIISPAKRLGYRKRSITHARWKNNGWQFGMIKKVGWEEIFVAIPDCPTHDPFVNLVANKLSKILPEGIPLYFLLVSGKSVTLVLKQKKSAPTEQRIKEVSRELISLGVKSFFLNWNPSCGNRVLATKEWATIFGDRFIEEDGIFHGPSGFRQQIAEMEDAALDQAEGFLHGESKYILDLFSGLGMSSKRWEKSFENILSIELVKESCEAFLLNAPKSKVLIGRVEERIPQMNEFIGLEEAVIYTNPPRMGHDKKIIDWMNLGKFKKIAYLSCNMKSLVRDLKSLEAFQVMKIQPYDFFPQTDHVEALALLERG